MLYRVTIRRSEVFEIEADSAEGAFDVALDGEAEGDEETTGHSVEEIKAIRPLTTPSGEEHLFVPVPRQTGCAHCGYARGEHPRNERAIISDDDLLDEARAEMVRGGLDIPPA